MHSQQLGCCPAAWPPLVTPCCCRCPQPNAQLHLAARQLWRLWHLRVAGGLPQAGACGAATAPGLQGCVPAGVLPRLLQAMVLLRRHTRHSLVPCTNTATANALPPFPICSLRPQILSEPSVSWRYELLYVPFILPFFAASLITVAVHRRDMEVHWSTPFREAFSRVGGVWRAAAARAAACMHADAWSLVSASPAMHYCRAASYSADASPPPSPRARPARRAQASPSRRWARWCWSSSSARAAPAHPPSSLDFTCRPGSSRASWPSPPSWARSAPSSAAPPPSATSRSATSKRCDAARCVVCCALCSLRLRMMRTLRRSARCVARCVLVRALLCDASGAAAELAARARAVLLAAAAARLPPSRSACR